MPGLCANPSHHPILQAAGSPRRWPEHASQRSASTLVRPSPVAVECGLGTPLPPRRLIARQATSRALGARLPPSRSNDTREGWRGSWHAPPGAPPSPAAAGGRIQPSAPPLTPFVTLLARDTLYTVLRWVRSRSHTATPSVRDPSPATPTWRSWRSTRRHARATWRVCKRASPLRKTHWRRTRWGADPRASVLREGVRGWASERHAVLLGWR